MDITADTVTVAGIITADITEADTMADMVLECTEDMDFTEADCMDLDHITQDTMADTMQGMGLDTSCDKDFQ